MSFKAVYEVIEDFFVNVAFAPLDALRALELKSWWAANGINFIFILIGCAAFIYWMNELKKYDEKDDLA